MTPRPQRPVGVTILAVLALIGGAFSLLAALGLFAIAGGAAGSTAGAAQLVGGIGYLLAVVTLASGVLALAFGIGSFMGASWAWLLGIIGEGLGVLSNLFSIGVGASNGNAGSAITSNALGLLIGIGIIAYLNSANVKAYFGR